jgi:hypothetical protein
MCIKVGQSERKYYLHKRVLIAECPYFATLLSSKLPSTEVAAGAVEFEGQGCTNEAFDVFVNYIYNGEYECLVPESPIGTKCLVHAHVYVLAERLCMDGLKQSSLEGMANELERAAREWDADCRLPVAIVVNLIDIVYKGTPDRGIIPHVDSHAIREDGEDNAVDARLLEETPTLPESATSVPGHRGGKKSPIKTEHSTTLSLDTDN